MTSLARPVAPWWTAPPPRHVCFLDGVDPDLLATALDPLPAQAPAVVRYRPGPHDTVTVLVDALDRAAIALFPHWLPGAERLDGRSTLGVAAVRALAGKASARTPHFGPFLADLAERAVATRPPGRFPPEVRVAGLVRVLRAAYGRPALAVLLDVPPDLPPPAEHALVAGAEWLAHHGRVGVWLAGAPLRVVDRIPTVRLALPPRLAEVEAQAGAREPTTVEIGPALTYPPLSGLPRADSAAETALERALSACDWAGGRVWNQVFTWHTLAMPYRLDLFWEAAGLVVEVDGDEHRDRAQFAADRLRDVELQLLGHDVLRFTNDQVLADVGTVVDRIHRALRQRRRPPTR